MREIELGVGMGRVRGGVGFWVLMMRGEDRVVRRSVGWNRIQSGGVE